MMKPLNIARRQALVQASSWAALGLAAGRSWAQPASERTGVVIVHGKNPASAQSPTYARPKSLYEKEGWLVALPDMPWSAKRYLDGHIDQAMDEIAQQVRQLRNQGAGRMVLIGHSIGVPMTMAYAARGGDVQALVHMAPGHVPKRFYENTSRPEVRDSVERARALVAQGQGDHKDSFADINQGKTLHVKTTAANYLSYFDPTSDAEMSITAPKLPPTLPVFTALGRQDSFFPTIHAYYLDSLPANPQSQFLAVDGGHLDTFQHAHDAVVQWVHALAQTPASS